jgi:endonuclease YncB( thermonuclease family)
MKSKPSGISTPTYNSILKDISQIYETAQIDGTRDWNKASLYSNWKIGERIVEVEQGQKERAAYGDKVLKQLSKDLNRKFGKGFSDRNLRYMRKFYQMYKLNQIQYALNWTQYRILLLVEDTKLRLDLENRAIREGFSHRDLLIRVNQVLAGKKKKKESEKQDESMNKRLKRPLMRLYLYRILQNISSDLERSVPNVDLGFSIRLKVNSNYATKQSVLTELSKLKVGSVVESRKKGGSYYFESVLSLKEMYTYKAYLERVIDGDTLLVNIDLGFSVFIEQRLRLRGLDAPELGTSQGNTSKKFVESRLKDCHFLIIKTHGSDKYDRYLVDVFYLKSEDNEDKILKEGIFLNNELLDEKMALAVE